jgi:hypothetical protein
MTHLDQTVHQTVTFIHTGALVKFARICSYRKFCVLNVHPNENLSHRWSQRCSARLDFQSIFSENWRQICKCTSLSPKTCTGCNLYVKRYRSLCGNSRALLSGVPTLTRADVPTLTRTDVQIASGCVWYLHWATLLTAGYEDGRPGGSVHMTEPSRWFNSRRNSHWFSGSCLNTQFHFTHTFRNSAALHVG